MVKLLWGPVLILLRTALQSDPAIPEGLDREAAAAQKSFSQPKESIYKKAIQLEEKGLIRGEIVKEGKMPEKAIYSLTEAGEAEFERLMFQISGKPINIFLDFNAVIVNLDSLPPEKQKSCIAEIEENISTLKSYLEHNIQKKENEPSIPATGMAVLRQQYVLVEAIQAWIASLKKNQQ